MALSARPIGLPTVPGAATGQVPSVGRSVASASFAPIDEISLKAEVQPDANFSFYDFADWMQHRSNPEAASLANTDRRKPHLVQGCKCTALLEQVEEGQTVVTFD